MSIRHKCLGFFSKLALMITGQTVKRFPIIFSVAYIRCSKECSLHALLQPAFCIQKSNTWLWGFLCSILYVVPYDYSLDLKFSQWKSLNFFIKLMQVLQRDSTFRPLKEFPLYTATFWGKSVLFSPSVLLLCCWCSLIHHK